MVDFFDPPPTNIKAGRLNFGLFLIEILTPPTTNIQAGRLDFGVFFCNLEKSGGKLGKNAQNRATTPQCW